MNIDLLLLLIVAVFAVVGYFSGAAKQIAQLVGLVVAYLCARPLGTLAGPKLAEALNSPPIVGAVAATLLIFILIMVIIRYALTRGIRRLLAGKDPKDRSTDRGLGAGFAALKVLAMIYVIVCALAFVEQNVSVAGKKLGLSPKDSFAFAVARQHNLFEMTPFSSVNDLVTIARAASDPNQAAKLRDDPAYRALKKDPRFQQAISQEAMQKAIESGDYQALLRSNVILQLLQDPTASARIAEAADAAEKH